MSGKTGSRKNSSFYTAFVRNGNQVSIKWIWTGERRDDTEIDGVKINPDNDVGPLRDGLSNYLEDDIMKKTILAVALAVGSIGMAHAAGFAIGAFGGAGSATSGTTGGSQAMSSSGSLGPGFAMQGTTATSSTSANSGVALNPQGTTTYANGGSNNQSGGVSFSTGFAGGTTGGMATGQYNSGATGNVGTIGFGGWTW